jgi:16S rRNA (adenine1518-N6/adenine1519-N6)-dimethyltransferase
MKKKYQFYRNGPAFAKATAGKANKLLGQHFLTSQDIVLSIIHAAEITKKDIVLEVGPGRGVLTEHLAYIAKKVIAVEKDTELAELLRVQYADKKNIEIITGDILRIDLSAHLPKKYKIVANLPYYITSHFLRIFLESTFQPSSMVLMVQWEVARRITAHPPDMNMLALSVQTYGVPKIIQKVSRSFFRPRPDVDSAIIKISEIGDSFFTKNKISPENFFQLTRKAFSQKRKMLHNSIGIDSKKRPQELSPDEWVTIYRTHK